MTCCEGRAGVASSYNTVLLVTLCVIWTGLIGEGSETGLFKDLPITVLQRHIHVSRHLPVCVIFRGDKHWSRLESTIHKLWNEESGALTNFSTWEVGAVTVNKAQAPAPGFGIPHRLPQFRCYLGRTAVYDYEGKVSTRPLRSWIRSLVDYHSKRLQEGSVDRVGHAVSKGKAVLVGLTSSTDQGLVEELLYQVKAIDIDVDGLEIFMVHHHSEDYSPLKQKYNVLKTPAVVYRGQTGDGSTIKKVFSDHDLDITKLQLFLMATLIPATRLTMKNFEAEVLRSHKSRYVPILIFFYATWAANSLPHLSAFGRTVAELRGSGARLRYGLVDVGEEKTAVSRWVEASFSVLVPFTLIFHLPEGQQSVKQSEIALSPSIPSPTRSYSRLVELFRNVTDTEGYSLVYQPWGVPQTGQVSLLYEGPMGTMCTASSHNLTDVFLNTQAHSDWVFPATKPQHPDRPSPHFQFDSGGIESGLGTVSGIPVLTNSSWFEVILRSHAPHHTPYPGGLWQGEVTKVSLVIFVIDGCGSCNRNMHTFTKLRHHISFISGGSVYLVNCTSDRALCKEQGISGFPTLTAYRGLGWLDCGQCSAGHGQSVEQYVRQDYHGVLLVQPVMDWFLSVTHQAVEHRQFAAATSPMGEDVRLVASLMPKLSRYLPIPPGRDYQYYLPYHCFRLACERLFGQVKCYTEYSRDIPASEFTGQTSQLVVSKVMLMRRDGVEMTLMLLGRSLLTTLVEQSSESGIHQYHTGHSHRYNLKPGVKCEDDHGQCTDVLVKFTRDHARLPLTQMTSALFHTKHGLFSDASRPVLVALVHQENITAPSPFLQTLTSVGYELYNEVVTVTVDVAEFPSWTGQFVPLGYSTEDQGRAGDLYSYPRLCLLYWTDHHRAAFYPTLDTQRAGLFEFTSKDIVDFVKAAIQSPEVFMIETERF